MANEVHFQDAYRDTAPEKLRNLSDESLDACHRYFVDVVPKVAHRRGDFEMAMGRINLLRNEMERRERVRSETEREQKSEDRHKETRKTAHRAIRLSKIGLVLSGIGVTLALVFGVLSYRANKQPSKPLSDTSDIRPSIFPSSQTAPSQATEAPTPPATTESPTPQPSQPSQLSPPPAQ